MRALRMLALLAALIVITSVPAAARPLPDVIPLPTGIQPEGIAIGKSPSDFWNFYVGSIPTGAVYRGDLRRAEPPTVLVPASPGRAAIGIKVDARQRLFVAGGPTGDGYVYDARTGETLQVYELAPENEPTFVNDVIVTPQAIWFTESRRGVLYRVPFGPKGALGTQADVEEVPLGGDFVLQPGFNANGISAAHGGRTLVIVSAGQLYTVDARDGSADRMELTGGTAANGDGLLLDGNRLYVVQNFLNRIAVIEVDDALSAGTVIGHLTHPAFDVPTTIAKFGVFLYAPNARFGIPNPQTASFSVVRVDTRFVQ